MISKPSTLVILWAINLASMVITTLWLELGRQDISECYCTCKRIPIKSIESNWFSLRSLHHKYSSDNDCSRSAKQIRLQLDYQLPFVWLIAQMGFYRKSDPPIALVSRFCPRLDQRTNKSKLNLLSTHK